MTKPIFILGSPRSGTSIIGLALRNGAGIVGYNEGHILSIIPPLIETITNCGLRSWLKNATKPTRSI